MLFLYYSVKSICVLAKIFNLYVKRTDEQTKGIINYCNTVTKKSKNNSFRPILDRVNFGLPQIHFAQVFWFDWYSAVKTANRFFYSHVTKKSKPIVFPHLTSRKLLV